MLTEIEKLRLKLEDLQKSNYANSKFYHLKSINNFLFHFEKITEPKKKREIVEKLSEYFHDIESEPIFDQTRSLFLFGKYIVPLGNIYCDEIGFTSLISLWVFLIWFFIISAFIIALNISVLLNCFTIFFLLVFYINKMVKKKQKKVFGYNW